MSDLNSTTMPPPHEDTDCHIPAPRYVVRTWKRGDNRYKFHAVFIGDLEAATKEAQIVAEARTGMWLFHAYESVDLMEGTGCGRLLATWRRGKIQKPAGAA